MPAIPVIMVAVAVAGTVASIEMQQQAAKQAAKNASSVANYNAALDLAQSKQTQLDSQTNVDRQRSANQVYLSRQRSAIAAAGVLQAGSPLDLMAKTAGDMETNIQDEWRDTTMSMRKLESGSAATAQEGRAQASAYKIQGQTSLFQGIGQLGQEGMGAYNSGVFQTKVA